MRPGSRLELDLIVANDGGKCQGLLNHIDGSFGVRLWMQRYDR